MHLLRSFVPDMLGLSGEVLRGVYLRPRRAYDVVVPVERSWSSSGLAAHLRSRQHDARPSALTREATMAHAPICKVPPLSWPKPLPTPASRSRKQAQRKAKPTTAKNKKQQKTKHDQEGGRKPTP